MCVLDQIQTLQEGKHTVNRHQPQMFGQGACISSVLGGREGVWLCGCAHSASMMPGPWIKSRVLDKPLSPSCWAPACLSKVISFCAVHFSNIEPLLAQGILHSLSPSSSLSSLNMLFLCPKYLSSPSHCQPDSILTVHSYLG